MGYAKTHFIRLLIVPVLAIIASFALTNPTTLAATTSTVTTEHVLYSSLSVQQHDSIIKGLPNQDLTHDRESFVLIYKPINLETVQNNIAPQQPNNTLNGYYKTTKPFLHTSISGELPDTSANVKKNIVLAISIVIILALISIAIWRRKYLKTLLLAYILIGGSLALNGVVNADLAALPSSSTKIVEKGTTYTTNTAVAGYEYVGYLHTYSDDHASTATGKVTVNYVDELGNTVSPTVTLSGNLGDNYTAEQKTINGYTYKSTSGNATGQYTSVDQSVTFVYGKEIGSIKVNINIDSSSLPSWIVDGTFYGDVTPIGYVLSSDHSKQLPSSYTETKPVGSTFDIDSKFPLSEITSTSDTNGLPLDIIYNNGKENRTVDGNNTYIVKDDNNETPKSFTKDSQTVSYTVYQLKASDRRLKKDIVKVGKIKDINIYAFKYKQGHGNTAYVGVMAQELLNHHSNAVIKNKNGYYSVNYHTLGFKMVTFAEYLENKSSIFDSTK